MKTIVRFVFLVAVMLGCVWTGSAGRARAQTPQPSVTPAVSATPLVKNPEEFALLAKPAVVRIFSGCLGTYVYTSSTGDQASFDEQNLFSGSGFFVNPDGYILTNAHVTQPFKEQNTCKQALFDGYVADLFKAKQIDPTTLSQSELQQDIQIAGNQAQLNNFTPVHVVVVPNGAQFPYEIKAYGTPIGNNGGKDVSVIKIEITNAPVITLGDSNSVQIEDHLTVVGYPAAADIANALGSKAALQATFSQANVQAKKTLPDGTPVLQISASTGAGNSGGPVLNDAGQAVGLFTFSKSGNNDGIYFLFTSDTAKEFLNQAGTTNVTGPVDSTYRQGLDLYYAHHYSLAINKFEEVKRLFPQHSETDGLIQMAQEQVSAGKDVPLPTATAPVPAAKSVKAAATKRSQTKSSSSSTGLVLALIAALVIVVLLAAGAVTLALRRREPAVAYGGYNAPPVYQPPLAPPAYAAPVAPPAAPPAPIEATSRTIIAPNPAGAPVRRATLEARTGPEAGKSWTLKDGETLIGRSTSNDIVVSDPQVSGRHAQVLHQPDGRYTITDLTSSNGTIVNGRRISQPVALRDGDQIQMAAVTLVFHA